MELGPISGFDISKDKEQEECLHRDSPNRETQKAFRGLAPGHRIGRMKKDPREELRIC